MNPRLFPLLLAFLCASLPFTTAADAPAGGPSPVQIQRAEKIAADLALNDAPKAARVRDIIANQYYLLSQIHAGRDTRIQTARTLAESDGNTAARDTAIQKVKASTEASQDKLRQTYLAALAAELTPAQIDQVKDGMTYGVLPNTFKVYQEMLPNLTAGQKAQILAWLTEAREHAMDASTSDEKHAWFGKYKGRINNYLAKAGIDMKQAEKDMFARKKETKNK